MTIECQHEACPHHAVHTCGTDEGPFCHEPECREPWRHEAEAQEGQDEHPKDAA